jgi:hypothetical protein
MGLKLGDENEDEDNLFANGDADKSKWKFN